MSSSIGSCLKNTESFSILNFGTSIKFETSSSELFIENLKASKRKKEKIFLKKIYSLELNIDVYCDTKIKRIFLNLFSSAKRLETTLKNELILWIDESRGTDEYENRVEASKKIYSCQDLNLNELNLSNLNLSNIPTCIFKIKNISILQLSNNRLTAFPKQIAKLTNLEKLDLTSNNLKSLPDKEIKILIDLNPQKKLQIFLNNNYLESLPSFYSSYSKQEQEFYFSESLKFTPTEDNLPYPACLRLDHFSSQSMGHIREKFLKKAINDLENNNPFHHESLWTMDRFITAFMNEISKKTYSINDLLSYIPISIRKDKNLILKLITHHPLLYIYLSDYQKNDFSIISKVLFTANSQNIKKELKMIYNHLPDLIWRNSDFFNFLEINNISIFLPDRYLEEKTIFLNYLPLISKSKLIISEILKKDPEVLLNVLKYYKIEQTNLKNDENLWENIKESYNLEKFSSWNPMFASFCPKSWLPNNENDAYAAVEINPLIFPFLHQNFQQNQTIKELAISKINSNLLKSYTTKFFSNPRSLANNIFNQTIQKISHNHQFNFIRTNSMLQLFSGTCGERYHPFVIFKEIIKISELNRKIEFPLNILRILTNSLDINKDPNELVSNIQKKRPVIIPFNISSNGIVKNPFILIDESFLILINYSDKSNQIKVYEYNKKNLSAKILEFIISNSNQHIHDSSNLDNYINFLFSTLIPTILDCQEIAIPDITNFKKLKLLIPAEAELIQSLFSVLHIHNCLTNKYYNLYVLNSRNIYSSFIEIYKSCLNFYSYEIDRLSHFSDITIPTI